MIRIPGFSFCLIFISIQFIKISDMENKFLLIRCLMRLKLAYVKKPCWLNKIMIITAFFSEKFFQNLGGKKLEYLIKQGCIHFILWHRGIILQWNYSMTFIWHLQDGEKFRESKQKKNCATRVANPLTYVNTLELIQKVRFCYA